MKQGETVQVIDGRFKERIGVIVKRCEPPLGDHVRVRFGVRGGVKDMRTHVLATKDLLVLRDGARP